MRPRTVGGKLAGAGGGFAIVMARGDDGAALPRTLSELYGPGDGSRLAMGAAG